MRDPQYLRHDAEKAVGELVVREVMTYCYTFFEHSVSYSANAWMPELDLSASQALSSHPDVVELE